MVTATVGFVAILMLLRELSIDVLPILTGAGIAGLAIGFGAQNLVRDVISGFFLILEDQVRVGDMARINGVAGMVEQINLRTIVLRDGEGAVQVFPERHGDRAGQSQQAVRVRRRRRAGGLQREHRPRDRHDPRGRRVDGARPGVGAALLEPLEIARRRIARRRPGDDPRQVQDRCRSIRAGRQRTAPPADGRLRRPRHQAVRVTGADPAERRG